MNKKLAVTSVLLFLFIAAATYGLKKNLRISYQTLSLAQVESTKPYKRVQVSDQVYQGIIWQNRFDASSFSNLRIEKSIFSGFRISNSLLQNMTLQETNMNGSQFNRTTLENVSFQGVSLKAAKFIQTNLRHISFEKTDLSQATFLACEFFEVRFDDDTKLPFSKERALLLGMTYVPKTN